MVVLIGGFFIILGFIDIYLYKKALDGNFYIMGTLIDFTHHLKIKGIYPIFRYKIDGKIYEAEYRATAYNYTARKAIHESKTNRFLKKIRDFKHIDFQVGREYKLLVNKNNYKEFWIAATGKNKFIEYKWLILGVSLILISFIIEILSIEINL